MGPNDDDDDDDYIRDEDGNVIAEREVEDLGDGRKVSTTRGVYTDPTGTRHSSGDETHVVHDGDESRPARVVRGAFGETWVLDDDEDADDD